MNFVLPLFERIFRFRVKSMLEHLTEIVEFRRRSFRMGFQALERHSHPSPARRSGGLPCLKPPYFDHRIEHLPEFVLE